MTPEEHKMRLDQIRRRHCYLLSDGRNSRHSFYQQWSEWGEEQAVRDELLEALGDEDDELSLSMDIVA